MTIDRRDFLGVAGIGFLGTIASPGRVIGNVKLSSPIQPKVVKHTTREISNGKEYEYQMTLTGSDGTVVEIKAFVQRIDLADSYHQTLVATYTHEGEVIQRTNQIIVGKKGSGVSGDRRYDDIEITSIGADGTIKREAMSNVPVLLNNPVANMPFDKMFALMSKYHEQTWTTGNHQTLLQFLQENAR